VNIRKIVAYTKLAHPCRLSPEHIILAGVRLNPPEGTKVELLKKVRAIRGSVRQYGYDPERDFREYHTLAVGLLDHNTYLPDV